MTGKLDLARFMEELWLILLRDRCRRKVKVAKKNHQVKSFFDKEPEEWGFCPRRLMGTEIPGRI